MMSRNLPKEVGGDWAGSSSFKGSEESWRALTKPGRDLLRFAFEEDHSDCLRRKSRDSVATVPSFQDTGGQDSVTDGGRCWSGMTPTLLTSLMFTVRRWQGTDLSL